MASKNHIFQLTEAYRYGGRILNVGCKEDPANISSLENVTNLDMRKRDNFTNFDLTTLPNFVQADFLTWEPSEPFDTVVLGEFLEHCTPEKFTETLNKCYSVLVDNGVLIITTPYDDREKYKQHGQAEGNYYEVVPGITTWHQILITEEYLREEIKKAGFKILSYTREAWFPDEGIYWHMVTARKIKTQEVINHDD